eukprot:TRINITY_DN7025_c0_g1_i1.p1 TRINITY_DN7025_c0_g1~~TRINITY_DN7025_c0_g1_i1.p1  ORF type:complete len:476 (-),score=29.76 TRINITY_DN7025_c0_g1_i1:9-1436(-)
MKWHGLRYGYDVVLFASVFIHLLMCPYTKVEESFPLQATHDLLYHGSDIGRYDHHSFPGVVPRSFIGSIFMAILAKPILYFIANKQMAQMVVRACLGIAISLSFRRFADKASDKMGSDIRIWLILIQSFQFHLPFYFSRTLPNTYALGIVILAFSFILENRYHVAYSLITFAGIVFRGELVLLLIPLVLVPLLTSKITFGKTVLFGILVALLSLATTILIDSYFWKRWLWPEGEVMYFNVYLNKSSEWGVSPWYWYFMVAVPKTLLTTIVLLPIGVYYCLRANFSPLSTLLISVTVYVAAYSILPHKELRFIFYAFPVLNLISSFGAAKITRKRHSYVSMGVFLLILSSLFLSVGFLHISSFNYPGGYAFDQLHRIEDRDNIKVHIDTLPAMTGVTRFGEINPTWDYSKEENITESELMQFNYLLTAKNSVPGFKEVFSVAGYDHIKKSIPPQIVLQPKVYCLISEQFYLNKRID